MSMQEKPEESKGRGFAHLGAQFCADHQHWHMPEEECHDCNPPPPRTPEELANDPVLAALRRAPPMSPEMAAKCRALMAEVVKDRPTFSMGVMDALLARRKKLAEEIGREPRPLRKRAIAALDTDRDLSDLLIAAADAIGDWQRATGSDSPTMLREELAAYRTRHGRPA